MAYLRMGDLLGHPSGVYVYMDVDGFLTCNNCALTPPRFDTTSTEAMISHLEAHRAAGHAVPFWDEVVAELRADDAENFPAR